MGGVSRRRVTHGLHILSPLVVGPTRDNTYRVTLHYITLHYITLRYFVTAGGARAARPMTLHDIMLHGIVFYDRRPGSRRSTRACRARARAARTAAATRRSPTTPCVAARALPRPSGGYPVVVNRPSPDATVPLSPGGLRSVQRRARALQRR